MAPAARSNETARELSRGVRRLESQIRRNRLTQRHACGLFRHEPKRCRNAAREPVGHLTPHFSRAPDEPRVHPNRRCDRDGEQDGYRNRHEQERERDGGKRERGARGRRQRGTGTMSSAACTAASGEYPSSSASGRRSSRCRSTSGATSATSSGVT